MQANPNDSVVGLPEAATVLDFWKWAFSDLCDDDIKGWIKGWYAEWIVGKLLGINTKRRISWANSDLITPSVVRIEVKATSYWQSWKLMDEFGHPKVPTPLAKDAEKRIRFAGLKAGDSVSTIAGKASYKSELYVFALQTDTDHSSWDALNLERWQFFLAKREQLNGKGALTLQKLRDMEAGPLSAAELSKLGKAAIAEIEVSRNADV